jgi:hypothetical protein
MEFQRVVEREVPVMYTSEAGELPHSARTAFQRLESGLDSLRGRRMYGLSFPSVEFYRRSDELELLLPVAEAE